jgi:hypothetical protein
MNTVPASGITIPAGQIGGPGLYFMQVNEMVRKFVLL